MKALECSQHFSHCKSMGIFSDGQGQLPPQSMIGSGQISSLLPAIMKKIRLNEGVRVFTTLYINFSDAQGDNCGFGGGIWPKFELIQALMHVLVT